MGHDSMRSTMLALSPGLHLPCLTCSADCPRSTSHRTAHGAATPQTLDFSAATGKALTTSFAGLALTITTLPKTSLLPAFVAGFIRVLILHKPGSVKMPFLTTSLVPMSHNEPIILAHTDFLSSLSVAPM